MRFWTNFKHEGRYSYEAFEASMRFVLSKSQSPESVHGGFSVPGSSTETKGYFRGPDGKYMNACLPLCIPAYFSRGYFPVFKLTEEDIDEQHWLRVEAQLEPLLGFFFTLDPLGFRGDQYPFRSLRSLKAYNLV